MLTRPRVTLVSAPARALLRHSHRRCLRRDVSRFGTRRRLSEPFGDSAMKHPASRELYAYWTAQRGTRRAPNRNQIDPGVIRGILGDSFMINREVGTDAVFRLAGTRICDMFGRELKGERFLSLWDARSHTELRMLL